MTAKIHARFTSSLDILRSRNLEYAEEDNLYIPRIGESVILNTTKGALKFEVYDVTIDRTSTGRTGIISILIELGIPKHLGEFQNGQSYKTWPKNVIETYLQ